MRCRAGSIVASPTASWLTASESMEPMQADDLHPIEAGGTATRPDRREGGPAEPAMCAWPI